MSERTETRRSPAKTPRRRARGGPWRDLIEALGRIEPGERVDIGGLSGGGPAWILSRLLGAHDEDVTIRGATLVVCPDESSADWFARDLEFFLRGGAASPEASAASEELGVVRLPADEILPYEDGSPDRVTLVGRLAALDLLERGRVKVLVTSARALAQRLPPTQVAKRHGLVLEVGQEIDRDEFARRLSDAGYQNSPLIEDPGSFAVRGGIIDLWPPRHELPVRVELFGDEIESLRSFDPETQRTVSAIERAEIGPARQTMFTPETIRRATTGVRELAGELGIPTRRVREIVEEIRQGQTAFGVEALLPAFYEGGLVPLSAWLKGFEAALVLEPGDCAGAVVELWSKAGAAHQDALARGETVFPPESHLLDPDQAFDTLGALYRVDVHELLLEGPGQKVIRFETTPLADLRRDVTGGQEEIGTLAPLMRRLAEWRKKRRLVSLACGSDGQVARFQRLLEDREIGAYPASGPLRATGESASKPRVAQVELFPGTLSAGFEDAETGLVVISEADVFGRRPERRRARRRTSRSADTFAASFRDLSVGDLVVHADHGIGKYNGLTRLEVGSVAGDFLLIEYAGRDKIYLPTHRLGLVQRYVGSTEGVRLDRLGGQSFAARKKRVKDELLKMAAELLDIYAARRAHPGTAFGPPDALYREFETAFPYDETEDQAKAIEDVLRDMQKPEPMDRLVCGDVGYGKTEVAMRAAMKAVLDGKQVVVLVPTTVLAAQHERTFRERFEGYPVIIETISRFHSANKTREILDRSTEGKVDILIGTHRLLSRDLSLKDLGLLVIDEEQRFGVAQKERLKKLRRQVDVMTLTATPIPRTLHMSLAGIRDLSIIATPPAERRSIRTFVSRFDGDTIREAVHREISRGGQIFFVHNRVQSIRAMADYLERILPKARIVVAHGQMSERELEKAMSAFVSRQADVLLSSSIIESGLDIPTVNTIVINRADTFGLAQLYQLRGRVGRSSDRAYCHLLIPARRPVTPKAKKRLSALQQLTELGSGFRLASHDMEIRGAGSLLGKQQSGHITAIGFDLYAEMLDEAVRELRGEPPREHLEPEVSLPLPAFIPEEWVPDVHQRLSFYKRLAQTRDEAQLEDLRAEMVDRFGRVPPEAENLLEMRRLAQKLGSMGLIALDAGPTSLVVTPGPALKANLAVILAGAEGFAPSGGGRSRGRTEARYVLTGEGKIVARLPGASTTASLLQRSHELLDHLATETGLRVDDGASPLPGPRGPRRRRRRR